ncbi:helix-turn-helix transcriptional regulator [uncultured Sphingomonas sp.]|uniref:helix-turn-helix transcriptional regulator n=1 Tax=uncultured Sphingomonas sp. TaxID=158754 RepID=UPI003748AC83
MDDEGEALIHGAYLAAMDDGADGWMPWLRRASDWIGGRSGYLAMVDRKAGTLMWDTIHHPDASALARYKADGIYLRDPQVAVVTSLTESRMYRDVDVIDPDDPDARFHTDWLARHGGTRHFVTAASVVGEGRWVGGMSIHNAVGQGVTSDAQWRRLASLSGTLERALAFGVLHAEKLREQWWSARLDAAGEPAALLDDRGTILRATPDFEGVLRRGDGLLARGGRLLATDPASQRRLATLVLQATASHGAAAEATLIERADDRPPYVLCGWPLVRERRALVPDHAAALVTLIDPLAAPLPSARLWRTAFGLTQREAEIAAALVAGQTPDEASATLGVTINTTRVHLRQIFAKTQTARQAELVRLLSRFGPNAVV